MDNKRVKAGSVSYLNAKPLIYGLEKGMMKEELKLSIDFPAEIAQRLIEDKIDIGLVPVAVIPSLKEFHILSNYCISCNGEVASVCLFSDVEIRKIKTILLDYQSTTSVALLKILLKDHWKISPELVMGETGYEKMISGTTAGLVIGDRAFEQRLVSKYSFDLGAAWKQMTGLPFLFAAWVSNKPLKKKFIDKFDRAVQAGLDHIAEIVAQNPSPYFDLREYYTQNIEYRITPDKMKAMELFLQKIHEPAYGEIIINT